MKTKKVKASEKEEKVSKKAKAAEKEIGKKAKAKKGKAGKPPTYSWQAPDTFTTSFPVEVTLKTEKDGMPGGVWRVRRYKGKYVPAEAEQEGKKWWNLAKIDPHTYNALVSRLSLVLFHPTGRLNKAGVSPRLAPNTVYQVLLRCGKKKADDSLTARINAVNVIEVKKNKRGERVEKATELDKKDVNVRKFKKANKHLPAAFRALAELPAKPSRRKKADEDED